MAKTAAQIITEKGGPSAFAAKVGAKPGTVRAWKFHNRFPRCAWPEITIAFPELTGEALLKLERAAAGPRRTAVARRAA